MRMARFVKYFYKMYIFLSMLDDTAYFGYIDGNKTVFYEKTCSYVIIRYWLQIHWMGCN